MSKESLRSLRKLKYHLIAFALIAGFCLQANTVYSQETEPKSPTLERGTEIINRNEVPSLVRIMVGQIGICTGNAITDEFHTEIKAVSASAHCFADQIDPNNPTVITNTSKYLLNFGFNSTDPTNEKSAVGEIFIHPLYPGGKTSHCRDLAILSLRNPIKVIPGEYEPLYPYYGPISHDLGKVKLAEFGTVKDFYTINANQAEVDFTYPNINCLVGGNGYLDQTVCTGAQGEPAPYSTPGGSGSSAIIKISDRSYSIGTATAYFPPGGTSFAPFNISAEWVKETLAKIYGPDYTPPPIVTRKHREIYLPFLYR